jgi:hypothetical protein
MLSLRKRVEALERSLPQEKSLPSKCDPKVDDEIMRLAEATLSEQDREICERLAQPQEPCRTLTTRECKAFDAYLSAIKLECERAGYRSLDEFQASYCGGQ